MLMQKSKWLIVLFINCISTLAISQEYADPFAVEDESNTNLEPNASHFLWDINIGLIGYHQQNQIRKKQYLDPGNLAFEERHGNLTADLSWSISANSYFSSYGRAIATQDQTANTESETDEDGEARLLEAYVSSYSKNQRVGFNLGRIKPQWSNGYNWSPANLMKPRYDRPSFDSDDLTQQHGFDLAHIDLRYNQWNVGLYIAQVENNIDLDAEDAYPDSDIQYAVSINREGDVDTRIVVHQLESKGMNYAWALSGLIDDSVTLRVEGAWEARRELPISNSLSFTEDDESGYLKFVMGSQISIGKGWDVTVEYLFNEHGFNNDEWRAIENQVEFAQSNLQSELAAQAYSYLASTYNLLSIGQLRQEYLFLMWGNTRLDQRYQYRQSLQYNLNDQSQYHNIELIQNWTEHFSSRLQGQIFTGCDTCEYGLLPSESLIRVSLYYDF